MSDDIVQTTRLSSRGFAAILESSLKKKVNEVTRDGPQKEISPSGRKNRFSTAHNDHPLTGRSWRSYPFTRKPKYSLHLVLESPCVFDPKAEGVHYEQNAAILCLVRIFRIIWSTNAVMQNLGFPPSDGELSLRHSSAVLYS